MAETHTNGTPDSLATGRSVSSVPTTTEILPARPRFSASSALRQCGSLVTNTAMLLARLPTCTLTSMPCSAASSSSPRSTRAPYLENAACMCMPNTPSMTFWFIFSMLPPFSKTKLVKAATMPSLSGPTTVMLALVAMRGPARIFPY